MTPAFLGQFERATRDPHSLRATQFPERISLAKLALVLKTLTVELSS
jgi:hypothetical protein